MLFAAIYSYKANLGEQERKRLTQLFTNWTPPTGWEMKAHYACADGSGGMAIAEGTSAAAMYEVHEAWGPFIDFKTVPLVDITESVPIDQKVYAWWDSVR
jgi:hypothetical protein